MRSFRTFKIQTSSAAILASMAFACQPMQKKQQEAAGSITEQFGMSSHICSTSVALMQVGAANAQGAKPATVEVQLGVCGSIDGFPDRKWKAIAAAASTRTVQMGSTAPGSSISSNLLIDDQGNLLAETANGTRKLGKFSSTNRGSKLDAEGAQKFSILISGQPFDVTQHSKESSGMEVWLKP